MSLKQISINKILLTITIIQLHIITHLTILGYKESDL